MSESVRLICDATDCMDSCDKELAVGIGWIVTPPIADLGRPVHFCPAHAGRVLRSPRKPVRKTAVKKSTAAAPKRRGRPPGSRNKPKLDNTKIL